MNRERGSTIHHMFINYVVETSSFLTL